MRPLDATLANLKSSGRKALVPYVVAGLHDAWLDDMRAAVHAGADAIEVGVPFSDPIMDGEVIQAASNISLQRGTTLASVLSDLEHLDLEVPVMVMTYYNIFHHRGLDRAAHELAGAGVTGTIVPDLSLEESGPWREAANGADVSCVLMVAPSSPPARAVELAQCSQGFVYAAARMAVTGAAGDEGSAREVVAAVRDATATPIYVGIGITSPDQAAAASQFADGVIVGTALVRRVLAGEGPRGVEDLVGSLRRAMG